MEIFPTAYTNSKYDPVFWSLAMTMTLGMWGIFMNQNSIPVLALQSLVCVVMAGWISAIEAQQASDAASAAQPAAATASSLFNAA